MASPSPLPPLFVGFWLGAPKTSRTSTCYSDSLQWCISWQIVKIWSFILWFMTDWISHTTHHTFGLSYYKIRDIKTIVRSNLSIMIWTVNRHDLVPYPGFDYFHILYSLRFSNKLDNTIFNIYIQTKKTSISMWLKLLFFIYILSLITFPFKVGISLKLKWS